MTKPDPNFIWSIADLLRGPYRPKEYGTVILPFTVLARLDAVLAPTKNAVLDAAARYESSPALMRQEMLRRASGQTFYNTSPFTLTNLGDPANLAANLQAMVEGFDEEVFEVFERFDMPKIIRDLDERDRLPEIVQRFAALDVHPDRVSNAEMGDVFEELIRRFMEASKDVAGDYFTPREVVRLMVSLLFTPDEQDLSDPHQIRQVYYPTCGTGGMLSEAHEWLQSHGSGATLNLFGQEFNSASYAMAKADLIIKRQDAQNIYFGDTLLKDGHEGRTFTYCLSNPPFGQEWKVQEKAVKAERERDGDEGRFAAGLPSVSDGAMLFLQHLVSKMRPAAEGGGRGAIVLNGSALFTGAAGSGPSEIRRWLLENDLVDAIVGLPTDMFYNTGIATYIWVLDNNKPEERRGRVQLIDATAQWVKMRKSIGAKRRMLSSDNIAAIVNLYGEFTDADSEFSKVFTTEDFGYRTITVEQPLRLIFSVDADKIERAMRAKQITALDKDHRHALRTALETLVQGRKWTNQADFVTVLGPALGDHGVTLKQAPYKAVVAAFAEPFPDGEIVTTPRGKVEPDPSLRDTENVPLSEDVDAYVEREVLPWAPEAWVDEAKTKVGYEIPFTRAFYKYIPPRPLTEIDADVQAAILQVQATFNHRRPEICASSHPMVAGGVHGDEDVATSKREARLCNVSDVRVSTVDKHTKKGEQTVRLCNYVDVYRNEVILNDFDFMEATCTPDEITRFRITPGDVVFTKDSETADDIGIPAFIETSASDLVCGYHVAIATPNPELTAPKFLFWLLNSQPTRAWWETRASGVTRVGLRQEDIRHLPLGTLPSVARQYAIADFLDHETEQIDAMIEAVEDTITLLRERREALITAALAGRIDPVTGIERIDPKNGEAS